MAVCVSELKGGGRPGVAVRGCIETRGLLHHPVVEMGWRCYMVTDRHAANFIGGNWVY
jgi:hypothetical protein